jgi:hypothetical protein
MAIKLKQAKQANGTANGTTTRRFMAKSPRYVVPGPETVRANRAAARTMKLAERA